MSKEPKGVYIVDYKPIEYSYVLKLVESIDEKFNKAKRTKYIVILVSYVDLMHDEYNISKEVYDILKNDIGSKYATEDKPIILRDNK